MTTSLAAWLGQLSFAYPAALLALLALPVIFWLLRTTPPRPKEVRFPPYRLLRGLRDKRRQPARTPWWLLALRLALAAALILALAGPRLLPQTPLAPDARKGPWLVVLDDGWAAARNWPAMRRTLADMLAEAQRRNAPVALLRTTPRQGAPDLAPRPPADWRQRLAALQPRALDTDRAAAARHLGRLGFAPARVIWLSDGIDSPGTGDFITALRSLNAPVRAYLPGDARLPLALLPPVPDKQGLRIAALRPAATGPATATIILRAANGRPLAQADAIFHPGATRGEAMLKVPPALRNESARLEIAGQGHAGAVWLLGDALRRKAVLVISGEANRRGQPLLAATYYATRALAPFADVAEREDLRGIGEWLKNGLSMLVLADVGRLPPLQEKMLIQWVNNGGVLLRFAGERIANASSRLLPVTLRRQERALGATLSWQKPQPLGEFVDGTPLAGLAVDREVKIRKQVLAEPDADLPQRTWAALADGTPLITARPAGKGWLVLVHVTASPQWSNLPLSGLFVRILQRIAELAPQPRPMPNIERLALGEDDAPVPAATQAIPVRQATPRAAAGAFIPRRMLTGRGELADMPPAALPIAAADFDKARPSPRHPAGLYARGQQTRALNIGHAAMRLASLPALPAGFTRATYAARGARDLARPLFIAAAVLFLLDLLAMLWLASGGAPGALLQRRRAHANTTALLALGTGLALALIFAPGLIATSPALAQQTAPNGTANEAVPGEPAAAEEARKLAFAMAAARNTRLAFVKSGDAQVDNLAMAGLRGLSEQLFERTSVEPDEPLAIDIERDDISFFPLLYWPVTATAPAPSPKALRKLQSYLKHGGVILFDTRDAPDAALAIDGQTPQRRALRRILEQLDIPPLQPVPRTHVLTRSFFLLKSFPGRYTESALWVEATSIGRERRKLSPANADGVSSVLITGNDLAAAWAISLSGQPLLPVAPGGERQREMAYRTGINIVMYALTGNYKADQVHLPTILQRLGQ